jgi:hypothetical protein
MADPENDPFGLRDKPRHEVERDALAEHSPFALRGAAQAELLRRDREYAEAQEDGRRRWEAEREQSRRTFEIDLFQAAGNRAAVQQEHEEKLARMQADVAREAALIQAQATESAAERQIQVGRWSAAAAVAAAFAALLSLAVTVVLSWMK